MEPWRDRAPGISDLHSSLVTLLAITYDSVLSYGLCAPTNRRTGPGVDC